MMTVPQACVAIPGICVFAVEAETAREVYFVTHSVPESIAPFLDGISERLDNQYRVPAVLDAITAAGRTGGEER